MAFPLANTKLQISVTALLEHYQQQMKQFLHYAKAVTIEHEIEAIHQLRVSIKNLRACLALFEQCSGGLFKKDTHFDLFSPLFKKAGRIRETQINLQLIAQTAQIKAFREYLEKQCNKQSQRLAEELTGFNYHALTQANDSMIAVIKLIEETQIAISTDRFLREKWSDAIEVMQDKRNVKNLHELRSILKVIREILVILDTVTHAEEVADMQQKLKVFHSKIGDWHDREVLQLAIRSYLQTHRDKELKRFSDQVVQKTKTRRTKLWQTAEKLFE